MYKLIRRQDEYEESIKTLDISKPLFCDTETAIDYGVTKGGLYGKVRLIQLYQEGWKEALIIDCFFVLLPQVLEAIQRFHQVWHNASYDLHTINLYTEELYLPYSLSDTLYLSKLTFYKKGARFGFYECLNYAGVEDDMIRGIDKKLNQNADWGKVVTPTMLKYAACDVLYLSLLYPLCKEAEDEPVYKLDLFNLKYAVEYARRGWPIDQNKVRDKLLGYTERLEYLLEELPVNPNSPKQVCEWLGTTSSDVDTLGQMRLDGNERAAMVQEARQTAKTINYLNTYNRPYIYGFYNASAAAAGRMSCTGGERFDHANLQQVPRKLLPCVVAPPDKCLVYMDFAGLELRLAASWIGEPTMIKLIKEGRDFHSFAGSQMYNIPEDKLTHQQRTMGKICNFLYIFGGSPKIFQISCRSWGDLNVSLKDATALKKLWLKTFPYFSAWHDMTSRAMNVYGYVDITTALGRTVRTYSVGDALNFPIQGSAAEVIKTALKNIKTRYPEDEHLISVIHDSITLIVPYIDKEMWIERLNDCMVDAWFEIISGLEVPDTPMPREAEWSYCWDF